MFKTVQAVSATVAAIVGALHATMLALWLSEFPASSGWSKTT